MVYFLDTNIFLRFFAKEGEVKVYNDCLKLIENLKNARLKAVTSNLVLAEIVWVLGSTYKVSKFDISAILKAIESMSSLKIIDEFQTSLANGLFENYSIKYIDALIASNPGIYSKEWTVVSYDKDFDKLGVIRKEPSEVSTPNENVTPLPFRNVTPGNYYRVNTYL